MITIGVLDLQGGVKEHLELLEQIPNVTPFPVKKKEEFNKLDGLILPGGESTTMGKLLNIFNLKEPIIELANKGVPIWGTCAGMILLAKEIEDGDSHLNLMNTSIKRNGYGSQLDSFKTTAIIPQVTDKEIPLVFIRAPYATKTSNNVEILLKLKDKIVAMEEDNLLATSFHPELEGDLSFHQYFVDKVKSYLNTKQKVI
ncbi:pyridoxal 5'-phosphate synthase glutaminase subunit PdxT [Halanaerocella petrolearia]